MSNFLVTGGTGFLGSHLARRLVSQGHQVTVLGRNQTVGHELERHGLIFQRVGFGQTQKVISACQNQEIVFHCGALSAPWGKKEDFHTANVLGMWDIIAGCRKFDVRRLVHVSTPSIYFDFRDRENISETEPLPTHQPNEYARTKLLAESLVDEAFQSGLPVVTLRPRAIFGPGDTAIFPRLLRAREQGRLKIIGAGKNLADVTFVDNVVDALLLASEAGNHVLGRKYNITNGEPLPLWEIVSRLFEKLGVAWKPRHVPYHVALAAATMMEVGAKMLPGEPEPTLTRYSVGVLAKTQTLDISAARRDLGYKPAVNVETGLTRFAEWWKTRQQT